MAHTCSICHRGFASANALQQHNQSTRRHANRCARCDCSFRSWEAYNNHLANDPAHKDNYCTRHRQEFGSYYRLHLHFSEAHTDTYCDICGQDFANSETLRQHKSTHYFCDTCELEFDSSDQLREHRLESVNHNYCNDCDEDFPTVSDLDYHWQSSHWHADNNGWDISDSPSEPVAFIEESSGEDWVERFLRLSLDLGTRQTSFYCSDCDRYFKTSNGLDQHRATASVHRNARVPRSVSTPDEDRCNKQGYSCPLCFDQGEDLSSAKCGHVFCTTCIHHALIEKSECPLCRASSVTADLRRIFLTF